MDRKDPVYRKYTEILEAELIPATGCTEPIAVAYAAAVARATLGTMPERCTVEASGNIIKNVKSVVVPNTGGQRGIDTAAAAGIVAGDEKARLEALAKVTGEQAARIRVYREEHDIEVRPVCGERVFFISVTVESGAESARVTIEDFHTNITLIEKNGSAIFSRSAPDKASGGIDLGAPDYSALSVEKIIDFADSADISDIDKVISRQIEYNTAISAEGLRNSWGAEIGRMLIAERGNDIRTRAKAAAAAGSDARMGGCDMPVIIVSGSGNQGMTASLPVIEVAKARRCGRDTLYRSLVVSDLITIYQKISIGRLSAFCGAVSAGCGAAAGIAYMQGGRYDMIAHTIVNTLGILSGMICDGAKASCAAKIAMAVEAGFVGYEMYHYGGNEFRDGEGIIKKSADNTIKTVGRMASEGMRDTDRVILDIMTGEK